MKNRNEILKRAFLEADIEDFRSFPLTDAENWEPSERFKRRMERLLRREKNPFRSLRGTALRRVAVTVCTLLILFSVTMGVEAIRKPIVEFFFSIFERYTEVTPGLPDDTDLPKEIKTKYTLTQIPEGYLLKQPMMDSRYFHLETYTDSYGNKIVLSQYTPDSHFTLDTEGVVLQNIKVGNCAGYYFYLDNAVTLSWSTEDYLFTLKAPESFSIEELLKMAESAAPAEP